MVVDPANPPRGEEEETWDDAVLSSLLPSIRRVSMVAPFVAVVALLWNMGYFRRFETLKDLPGNVVSDTKTTNKSIIVNSEAHSKEGFQANTSEIFLKTRFSPLRVFVLHVEHEPNYVSLYCMHIPLLSRLLGLYPSKGMQYTHSHTHS